MSQITERARATIDSVKVPYPGPLHKESAYIKALRALPNAAGAEPLASALDEEEIVGLAEEYRRYDKLAVQHQRYYRLPRVVGITAAYFSVLLAGLSVYASGSNNLPLIISAAQPYLALTQSLLIGLIVICMIAMYNWSGAKSKWATARAWAEDYRARFYAKLMSGTGGQGAEGGGAAWLLALRLECFRRHLLEDQSHFFKKRIWEHRWLAWAGKGLGWLAILLIVGASVPQMVASVTQLAPSELFPESVRSFIDRLVADRTLYSLAWVYGSSLQLVLARLVFVSPVARHIDAYKVVLAVLTEHTQRLPEAREAAARGDFESVKWFTRGVQDTLEGERRLWDDFEVFGNRPW